MIHVIDDFIGGFKIRVVEQIPVHFVRPHEQVAPLENRRGFDVVGLTCFIRDTPEVMPQSARTR